MEKKTQFKVGDSVEVIANTSDHMFPIGTIATIAIVFDKPNERPIHYLVETEGDHWYLGDDELKIHTP